jgi:two-component system cell cycle sensor histidine kinase/response regulator CckA
LGKPRSEAAQFALPFDFEFEQSEFMSAVSEITWAWDPPQGEFNSFFDQAPVGLAQCRLSGQVIAINPALQRILHLPLRRSEGLNLVDLVAVQDSREAEDELLSLFDGKRDTVQFDCKGKFTNSLRWTVWRVPARNGEAGSVLAMVEEIRRSPEVEQRLQQAARLESLGKLAGGVAHDFNNVLTGVLLCCDLLMASLDSSHAARKYAEEIRKAALQASGLVKQLLAITRPHSVRRGLLSLNDVADGMRNLLGHLVGQNIQLQFRLDPNLGLTRLDPTQAQQILLNLVLNARDAISLGGQITVETGNCKLQAVTESALGRASEAALPCVLFSVRDNGCGMDEATRAHLFEPFFTTKGGKGTGLGLATVHEIVTSSGGLIHVSSEPAHGTRVSVLLPLALPAETPVASGQQFYIPIKREVLSSQEED